jgi:dephospho-CoA kinase
MRIVGLTGGIGAGKSTVAAGLARRGAIVVDVDGLGRKVISPGGIAEQAIIDRFGTVDCDGHLDRAALASIVFNDAAALADLEDISHPAINLEMDQLLDTYPLDALVVLDMAILLGSRLGRNLPSGRAYDTVVVVETPLDVRIDRLVSQRGMSESDARARIASQPSDEDRRAIADFVISNDAGLERLDHEVARLMGWLNTTAALT